LSQVIVVNPAFVTCVVRRIDIDAFILPRELEQCFKGQQVVAFYDQVAIETRLLTFTEDAELRIELKRVVRDGVMIRLDSSLPFELQKLAFLLTLHFEDQRTVG